MTCFAPGALYPEFLTCGLPETKDMLKKLTVHGFKSIERQIIELGSLNVLIGANGSGKSNLLAALSFFRTSALGHPDAYHLSVPHHGADPIEGG